jgi:hypothetical protein
LAIGFEEWISKQNKPFQPEVFSPVPTFFNGGQLSIIREKETTDLMYIQIVLEGMEGRKPNAGLARETSVS